MSTHSPMQFSTAPRRSPFADDPPATQRRERLAAVGAPLRQWLVAAALPRWATTGTDRIQGGFFEKISLGGEAIEAPRRARVVARQIYVFATAARHGWLPGAADLMDHGLDFLFGRMRTAEGTMAASVNADGSGRHETFDLYEHAFILFALASAYGFDRQRSRLKDEAQALLVRMRQGWCHPHAGFEEASPRVLPLKSNPHMHLLEAALAWARVTEGEAKTQWTALVDEIIELCLERFIDANGALHEYFDGDWRALPGREGRIVEPGHQFEWAWLLMRSADGADAPRRLAAARRLLEIGESHGVDATRGVAVNELDDAFGVTDAAAKLWPQTERIKAWHLAAATADAADAGRAEAALQGAVEGLGRYIVSSPSGLWREQMEPSGRFEVPDTRASSLYHIVCAVEALVGDPVQGPA